MTSAWGDRADGMQVLEHIGPVVRGLGAALVIALMAWAGSHQS